MKQNYNLKNNIEYTQKRWTGYLRYLGWFLYTERIHYFYLYKFLRKYNNLTKYTVLLDIGFGSGYNIEKINKKFKIKTIGVDIVQKTVDIYNKKKLVNSYALKMDAVTNTIPLNDTSADIIVCSHILEHVPDDKILLKEVKRVLKEDGIVYFNIPINEENIDIPNHIRKYSAEKFRRLLEKAGFKCIKSIESDIFTNKINYWGVNKTLFNNIKKKLLIFILSLVPISILEKFKGEKSQFICFARK